MRRRASLTRVMRKNDLTMVFSFDTDADLLADFTDDLDSWTAPSAAHASTRRADKARWRRHGPGTVFYDAVYLACHDKLASEAGRKALIILTDAQDEGSQLNVQDAIEAAQRTDTVVHILLVGDPFHFSVNEGVAKKLTDETGGRTIVVRRREEPGAGFRSDQRRTSQPVHHRLLLDQRGARRQLSQDQSGHDPQGPGRPHASRLLRAENYDPWQR